MAGRSIARRDQHRDRSPSHPGQLKTVHMHDIVIGDLLIVNHDHSYIGDMFAPCPGQGCASGST